MARPAGGVTVRVSAEDAQFQTAMRSAGRAFRRNEALMKRQAMAARRVSKGFTVLRATVASFAGATLSGLIGRGALAQIQGLRAEYSKLGATLVEIGQSVGIAGSELQSLRRAFSANGVSAEKTDRALGRLNRTFAEAQDLATYRRSFEQLGVDIDALRASGAGTMDILNAVADGIARTGDRSVVASAAAQLLGRDWQQMAVVLSDGAAGLARTREELDKFGLVSDEHLAVLKALEQAADNAAQAQTTTLATASAEAAAAMDVINQALELNETFWKRWAIRAAQAIGHVISQITGLKASVETLTDEALSEEIVATRAEIMRLNQERLRVEEQIRAAHEREQRFGGTGVLGAPRRDTRPLQELIDEGVREFDQRLKEHLDRLKLLEGRALARIAPMMITPEAPPTATAAGVERRPAAPEPVPLAEAWRSFYAEQARIAAEGTAVVTEIEQEALKERTEARDKQIMRVHEMAMAAAEAEQALIDEVTEAQRRAAEEQRAAWQSAADSISGAFGRAWEDVIARARSGTEAVQGLVNSLISSMARLWFVDPFESWLGGALGPPRRHIGGGVSAGQAYNWRPGEEVFIPSTRGRVEPVGAGASGATVIFQGGINLPADPSLTPEEQRMMVAEAVEERVADAFRDMRRRSPFRGRGKGP